MILTVDTIQKAMTGQRVGTLDEASLKVALAQITTDVAALAGFESQIFGEQTDELARDIRGGYPRLTLDEIRLACKAGVSGEFGIGGRPTYASVTRWVREYDNCAMVADARKGFARKPVETRRLTEAEGLAVMRSLMPRNLKAMWDSVRAEGRMRCLASHAAAQILDWLRDEGVVTVDQDLWRKCVSKARSDTGKRHAFDISNLESGQALIRSIAKRIYLEAWLYGLHRAGKQPMIPAQVRRIYQ